MMLFYPDLMVDKITDITDKILDEIGVKNILLDIDDTISPNDRLAVSSDVLSWIEILKQHSYKILLISNNCKDRAQYFAECLDVPYIYKAMKPFPSGINRGLQMISAEKDNTVLIGDQIFTDVAGAKMCKIKSILVEPLSKEGSRFLKFKRLLESCIKNSYKRR